MNSSFGESVVGLIVGLERGVLPKANIIEDLLDRVADARSDDTAKMGPDLWGLCMKLDKDVDSKSAASEDISEICCALHLLTFRLHQSESRPVDMESGLTLFIVALKTLSQLIKYHWSRSSTTLSDMIWNPKVYDELLACLSTVFKVVFQQSFLFKSCSPELLHQIFIYNVVELKLLFIRVYEKKDSGVLLDRLAYAASFYRKNDQQDAIINLILEGIAIRPYRQSLYKTNLSFVDRIFRILKQIFELKAASKQSLANILRTFADASILTALMKTPISVGYSVDFCIEKSQELWPWPLADAILKIKRVVYNLLTTKSAHSHIELCQLVDAVVQDALATCSRIHDTADVMFAGLSHVLSFLAETGFLSSAIRASKNIIDRALTGLLTFNEGATAKSTFLFHVTQSKDVAVATGTVRNNQLYATKIACVIVDTIILTEDAASQQEIIGILSTLRNISNIYITDSTINEYNEMTDTLHSRLFYFVTSLISRGDIPCQQLLEFVHSVNCHPRSIIIVVQYALTEIEKLYNRVKGVHHGSSSSLSTPSQDGGEAIKELLISLTGQSTSLLRDIQQRFNDKTILNSYLIEEYGVTRYEFYYLFISVLLYGQDVDCAIQLTKHVTTLLEMDEDLKLQDFEVLVGIAGLYITRQHNSSLGNPSVYSDPPVASILTAMLQALIKRYLSNCTLHNKYLKAVIEHSIELSQELIHTGLQSAEISCTMFTQARKIIDLYISRVGMGRFMPHELDTLQCAIYKLFMSGYSSIISKTRKGEASALIYDIIALYRILLSFTAAMEEREPAIKKVFSTIHKEGYKGRVDSMYSSTLSHQHTSQEILTMTSSFNEQDTRLNVGLILCASDLNSHKSSTIKQSIFVKIVCQYVLSWTVATDEQIDEVISMLSAMGNYLSIISNVPDLGAQCLQIKEIRHGSQSIKLISVPDIIGFIHQLKQERNTSISQILSADLPIPQIAFYYAVLLIIVTAKVSLLHKEKYISVFTTILTNCNSIENRDLLIKLIEHTLGLTLEVDCRPVSDLLLERYSTLDPVSCVYTYTLSSSNIDVDVLVTLLTALVEASEKDPEILINDKVQQIINLLDKGPIQNATLSQLLIRLKVS